MVAELREFAESHESIRVLTVFQASVDAGEKFFEKRWPGVQAIADPDRLLYAEFGLRRGSLRQFASPRVFMRAFAALARGNFVGRPIGDPRTMPGMFLIQNGTILREHVFEDAGDHPDLETFVKVPHATHSA